MTTTITLDSGSIDALSLAPVQAVLAPWIAAGTVGEQCQTLQFEIQYPQATEESLELPEIAEVRLWFICLDSYYPWLPYLLDWQSGELVRYAAMLVPHEFSPQTGIQFNPQALDIFVMQKVCVIARWLQDQQIDGQAKLMQMAAVFGYELDSGLFDLLAL